MVKKVSEVSNLNDKIVIAAQVIGKSAVKRAVFTEIYRGKNNWKTVVEIHQETGLSNIQVLKAGAKLAAHDVVEQIKVNKRTAYRKDKQLAHHRARILKAAGNKAEQDKLPTARNPKAGAVTVKVLVPRSATVPKEITIDGIASFAKVRGIKKPVPSLRPHEWREEDIKSAFKRILGETHDHKDWGGEKNDLFTNKLRLTSTRQSAAIAFKGRATSGTLTPSKMGTNGDQIERLVGSTASVFLVVYHGKVAESIYGQLHAYALGKSIGGRRVSYGVIDGDDLNRMMQAYPSAFATGRRVSK
jgi:hypothetical protein